MTASKPATPTASMDPDDAPELSDAFFDRADLHQGDKLVRRGRPKGSKAAVTKARMTLRMEAEALERWRASGPGWQTRAAALLAEKAPR